MSTWRDEAISIIGDVHAALPPDADVKARKRALNAACPHHFRATSWGRKVWGKAATKYLVAHGMKPPGRPRPKDLEPIETAPTDGTVVDFWRSDCGWIEDVWFDRDGGPEGDGWVTIAPRPFEGWRLARGYRQ